MFEILRALKGNNKAEESRLTKFEKFLSLDSATELWVTFYF
jgi:hypothetical protein